MRMTTLEEAGERSEFAKRAAHDFEKNEDHYSYTDSGSWERGELLAIRWGLGKDCVLIVKLSDDEDGEVYQQAIAPTLEAGEG